MEKKVFVVTELSLWNGEDSHNVWVYGNKENAQKLMQERVEKFETEKCLEGFMIDRSTCSYECFRNDDPKDDHFCVWVQARIIL